MSDSYLDKASMRRMPSLDRHGTPIDVGEVQVELSRCTGCGLCVSACPAGSLEMPGKREVRMTQNDRGITMCFACGDCVATCEPAALRLTKPLKLSGYFEYLHRGELTAPRKF
jgi:ferredoxin